MCKNITLPQTSFAGGNNRLAHPLRSWRPLRNLGSATDEQLTHKQGKTVNISEKAEKVQFKIVLVTTLWHFALIAVISNRIHLNKFKVVK